jgi:serine/threonine-protein kinase HipA
MSRRARELAVSLNETPVGTLRLLENERSEFSFLDSYRELPERPVLSQLFEDDLNGRYQSRMRLTAFFSNLLPEGALRALLANKAGVHPEREFFLIQELEEDLPGAVRIRATGEPVNPEPLPSAPVQGRAIEGGLRFSLAGVQLKFSMIRSERGLTIPMKGEDGDWIAKLPDSRFAGVPENEFVVMGWARTVGIQVPEVQLHALAELHNLPPEVQGIKGHAFVVRRFDRAGERRIHIEDFAQVFGRYAHDKYEGASYENIGQLLFSLNGERALEEYVRRLAFMALVGNADAHLKNWSLIYPDSQHAVLSPAYDLVAVVAFLPNQQLGLSLGGSKRFEDVSFDSFRRFAKRVHLDEGTTVRAVRLARDQVLATLHAKQSSEAGATLAARLISEHLPRIPLATEP